MAYVVISRRAARDLEEIRRYSIEQWGDRVAEDYLGSMEQALDRLRQAPQLLRGKPTFSRSLRFYRVNRHFLVCALVEANIYVLAVKHGSLDLPTRLAKLEPGLRREADLLHKAFLAKMAQVQRTGKGPQDT